jgi:hypothetical protein
MIQISFAILGLGIRVSQYKTADVDLHRDTPYMLPVSMGNWHAGLLRPTITPWKWVVARHATCDKGFHEGTQEGRYMGP